MVNHPEGICSPGGSPEKSNFVHTKTLSFSYNDEGIRTSKTVNGTKHTYSLSGSQILSEEWYTGTTQHLILYVYDANGSPIGMRYRNSTYSGAWLDSYMFVKNLQGDIIYIYDEDGNRIVTYSYDAWGNILSVTGSAASTIGVMNPFRYRGYYYDEETAFYLTGTRYYNPEIGRFINADNVISGTGESVQGYNLFAYCFNNPVNMDDQTGNWPKWIKNTVKWVAKNIVKPVVKTVQKTLSKVDATYSHGINVSGTPSAFIFNLQAGISIDTKGNVAIQGSAGVGVKGGSPDASITAYQSVTNAPSIDKLEGPGYQIGGSVGVPVYGVTLAAGGDFNLIPDSALNTTYLGATTDVGFGTPGGEFHIERGETATWNATRFNIFDVAEDVYIKIMEW